MTTSEACTHVVDLTKALLEARRERDREWLRADRHAAAYHEQDERMRRLVEENYRLHKAMGYHERAARREFHDSLVSVLARR